MSANDPRNDESPWTRPSVVGSGVFILALIIAAIVIFALPGDGHKHHSQQDAQAPTTTATATTSTPQGAVKPLKPGACTLPPGPQAIPSSAPPSGTTWQSVDAMVVPQAPNTYGPQHIKDGFYVCFAHSPAGALLADLNVQAAATTHFPTAVFAHLGTDVPRHISDNTKLGNGKGGIQIAGYKYTSYSSDRADITIVFAFPGGAYEAVATDMKWVGDDWRFQYPPGGAAPSSQINSLTGYVKWKDL
jgi:hypothetical protein